MATEAYRTNGYDWPISNTIRNIEYDLKNNRAFLAECHRRLENGATPTARMLARIEFLEQAIQRDEERLSALVED